MPYLFTVPTDLVLLKMCHARCHAEVLKQTNICEVSFVSLLNQGINPVICDVCRFVDIFLPQ